MAHITYIPTRRVILTALQRVVGSRSFVILISLGLGTGLYLWARSELVAMFVRSETGEIVIAVEQAGGDCPPPSLYFLPSVDEPDVYLGVVDTLGGGLADPSIMNIGRPSVALTYDGGAGIDPLAAGRAVPADCPKTVLHLGGGFTGIAPLHPSDQRLVNVAASAAARLDTDGDGATLTVDLGEASEEGAARAAFRVEGLRDIWQYGYRRINFWNGGGAPVNVFLLGDPQLSFMSENFEPVSVPLRNRSIVAMHLPPPGRDGGNAYQVFSRYIDYDARLQSRLITVSTVFGIGISLLVEGAILALLRLARHFRPAERAVVDIDVREDDDG